MSAKFFGDAGGVKLPGSSYSVDKNGKATFRRLEKGNAITRHFPGERCPEFQRLRLSNYIIKWTGEGCENREQELIYEGLDAGEAQGGDLGDMESADIREQGRLEVTASQEPIETHPRFLDFAGTPSDPKNGAQFNPDGSFNFFKHNHPDDTTLNKFAGVSAYLQPRVTFTADRIAYHWPQWSELVQIGFIVNPADFVQFPPPSFPPPWSWLYSNIQVQHIGGNQFKIQRQFMLSGPKGWLPDIYAQSLPPA